MEHEGIQEAVVLTETVTPESPAEQAVPATIARLQQEEQALQETIARLQQEERALQQAIAQRQQEFQNLATEQLTRLREALQASLDEWSQRKQALEDAIAILQRKQERIQQEMRTTYAGTSQEIAVRVQGFRDYLVGSLQDLAAGVERLNLVPAAPPAPPPPPPPREEPRLAERVFGDQQQRIGQMLDRFCNLPDYYGPPWKLRRTFEPIHAQRVSAWFAGTAGRGAMAAMGTRLQNILLAAAAVSVLHDLYGERLRVLVLASSPERLGEWRRGFQDCLGLTREHFGVDKGITLFEDPEPMLSRGERLLKENLLPLAILDEAEELIPVDVLRLPMVLAFYREVREPVARGREDSWDF